MQVIMRNLWEPKQMKPITAGNMIFGWAILTAQQHVTGKDPNSGKTNNAGKSQALCFNTVVMFRLRRMDYSFFFFQSEFHPKNLLNPLFNTCVNARNVFYLFQQQQPVSQMLSATSSFSCPLHADKHHIRQGRETLSHKLILCIIGCTLKQFWCLHWNQLRLSLHK